MFWRRKKAPWYAVPLGFSGVVAGLLVAERIAPIISNYLQIEWLLKQGKAAYDFAQKTFENTGDSTQG